jgi:hypothetical protein
MCEYEWCASHSNVITRGRIKALLNRDPQAGQGWIAFDAISLLLTYGVPSTLNIYINLTAQRYFIHYCGA